MDFLSLALQCSFLPVSIGPISEPVLEAPGFVLQSGIGEPCKSGDRITLDFWIRDEKGKEIANSERRGLCQTFDLFGRTGDTLLNSAALGAREGEERFVILLAEEWLDEVGPFNLVQKQGPLLIRIRVSRLDRR
jgi:hypothetical protein